MDDTGRGQISQESESSPRVADIRTFSNSKQMQLDWKIALPLCIMFVALQLDRGNITQALSDKMLGKPSLEFNCPSIVVGY